MKILAVDDEKLALAALVDTLKKVLPTTEILAFRTGQEAYHAVLDHPKKEEIKVAFLDIELRDMKGITLASQLKQLLPDLNIVFCTGYSDYALDAFQLYASAYLMKPITEEHIREAMTHLRSTLTPPADDRLFVQCFGDFCVFKDNKPISFTRQNSKELFAYLVDRRGAATTMAEIANILWEDGIYDVSRNKQLHTYISALRTSLAAVGATDVLLHNRNSISIDTSRIRCDYYDYLDGNPTAARKYNGEYMRQYSWAEDTNAGLMSKLY